MRARTQSHYQGRGVRKHNGRTSNFHKKRKTSQKTSSSMILQTQTGQITISAGVISFTYNGQMANDKIQIIVNTA